jgi:hypothetical protein
VISSFKRGLTRKNKRNRALRGDAKQVTAPELNPPFSEYLLGRLQKTAGLFPSPCLPGFRKTRKAGNVKKLTFLFCPGKAEKRRIKEVWRFPAGT